MGALWKKLFRDLWHLRAQVIAIAVVVAAGVSIFYSSMGTLDSLLRAQAEYYARFRLAEVYAHVVRAPLSAAKTVAAIPGVAEVRPRVALEVAAEIPGVREPGALHLVTMPRDGALNGVYLRRGAPPLAPDEIVINEIFAESASLDVGAIIPANIHGQRHQLRVVGVGLSPEFVFQLRAGDLMPDNRRFGVAWMEEKSLAAAADMTGAFDDLVLTLAPDAREADVIAQIDRALSPWGSLGALGRRDGLISHRYLSDEFEQLRASARLVPAVFLGVAAFLLNVVLSRLVATQRAQIGTLKAFGMSDVQIGVHYLAFVFVVVLAGAIVGLGVGEWLGRGMVGLYQPYYRFPNLVFLAERGTPASGVAIALLASSAGAIAAVRRATSLPPAEAMRPEPPPAFRASMLDGPRMRQALSTVSRMVLRNLLRRPVRSALSVLGVALAAAIVVVVGAMGDAMRLMTDVQFGEAQRSDATVVFAEARPLAAARELASLPGVLRVEPFRGLAVKLHHQHHEYRAGITGVPRDGLLRRLVDEQGRAIAVPDEGMVVSRVIADALEISAGDVVDVEALEGSRWTRPVLVAAVIDDMTGVAATMDLDALSRLDGGARLASGVELRLDPSREREALAALRARGQVVGVTLHAVALASFREILDKNLGTMQAIELVFAMIIAAAVVFNSARTALSERARELATLRVLGFSNAEVAGVLLGELAAITAIAVPLGLALGSWLARVLLRASSSDLFRIPYAVAPATYSTAALVVVLSAFVSALAVGSRVGKLDLVGVLKTRD
jgi:putative ABC transport system permease protein